GEGFERPSGIVAFDVRLDHCVRDGADVSGFLGLLVEPFLAELPLIERPMHQAAAVFVPANNRRGAGDATAIGEAISGFRCWHRSSPPQRHGLSIPARALASGRSPTRSSRVHPVGWGCDRCRSLDTLLV